MSNIECVYGMQLNRWAKSTNSWNCNTVRRMSYECLCLCVCIYIWPVAYHYSVFDFVVCRATTLVEGRTMNLICHYSGECGFFLFSFVMSLHLMHASLRFNTINDIISLHGFTVFLVVLLWIAFIELAPIKTFNESVNGLLFLSLHSTALWNGMLRIDIGHAKWILSSMLIESYCFFLYIYVNQF